MEEKKEKKRKGTKEKDEYWRRGHKCAHPTAAKPSRFSSPVSHWRLVKCLRGSSSTGSPVGMEKKNTSEACSALNPALALIFYSASGVMITFFRFFFPETVGDRGEGAESEKEKAAEKGGPGHKAGESGVTLEVSLPPSKSPCHLRLCIPL